MEGKKLFPTKSGTPQGGVISPLLANIALHGIEELIKGLAPKFDMRKPNNTQIGVSKKLQSISIIRYADDLVVLHKDLKVINLCRTEIEKWLSGIGLELNPSKTRIAHTLKPINNEEPGFNFLGFNVRQFPVGKYRSGKNGAGKLLGFKTIITPSKESQKRHYRKAAEVINKSRGLSQAILIKRLNPIIRGWCSYFSTVVSQKVLERLGRLIFWKLWKWGVRRHPNKNRKWIRQKYFKTIEGNNWAFATKAGKNSLVLRQHSSTEIKRHIKVKGNASPYDGNWVYWSIRMGKHPEISVKVAKLLKQQKGKCAHCGSYFKDGDSLEVDHIIPKSKGGKDRNNNWQLLHRHCHDKKTSTDGSFGNKSSCNSAKPKPPIEPGKYIWENDMLVMTF
jgi:RNA-directed DNA polymerase